MKFLALVLCLLAAPLFASPVTTWDGPGPNACAGNCTLTWAKTLLTDEQLAELEAAMEENPDGELVMVTDGDYLPLMTYYDGESPQADFRGTIATLENDEPATGWVMDGWSFIKIHGCQNWAIVKHGTNISSYEPDYDDDDAGITDSILASAGGSLLTGGTNGGGIGTGTGTGTGGGGGGGCCTVCCTVVDPNPPTVVTPAPVPLPASVFGLIFALVTLGSIGYAKNRKA